MKFIIPVCLLALLATPALAEDVTLRIATTGGDDQAVVVKYIASRFTADTGIHIEFVNGNPPELLQKLLAARGRPAPFDVVSLDDKTQPQAIEAGVVAKLDTTIVTNLAWLYDQARQPGDQGVASLFWSWGLAYNARAFADHAIPPPTSWEDLWNPKLAGKVAIADITGPGGVDFVLKAAQISGGSETNLLPGLHRIAGMNVNSYFTSSNDLHAKFLSGDVWAAPWNNGRSWDMIDAGFPLRFIYPKEGGFLHVTTVNVVATSKHQREAQRWVNYVLDPLSQLGHLYEVPFGPVNRTLAPVLAAYPELAKKVSVPGLQDSQALTIPAWTAIFDHYADLVDSWNRIVKTR